MASITIKDIARLAKVTPATVSYVLNGRPGVSEEKRKKILKIIEETGYIPSLSSRKLVLKRSFNIHIVVSSAHASFDNLFYNTAIKRMMEICMQKGYNLVLSNTENFENSGLMNSIAQRDVDGVVFLLDVSEDVARCLKKNKIPYVVLDAQSLDKGYSAVYCDYCESAYTATEYLISKGHTNIGFVGMKSIKDFYDATLNGYKKALSDSKITSEEFVFGVDNDEEDVNSLSEDILKFVPEITAIFCATDVIAVNLMKALTKKGVKIPDDISVCGLDDVVIAKYATPALTTIEIDKRKMGEEAISLLINKIDGEDLSKDLVCVHSKNIIERESILQIKG